jgi:Leucine-rich repeat (LRR) protein
MEINITLQSLLLVDTKAAVVCSSLARNSSLTTLDLSTNNIAELPLREKSQEELVSLSPTEQIPFCREAFWMFMKMSCSLSSLLLNNNNLGDEGASALAQVLISNQTLTYCNIASNGIGPKGIAALSQALAVCCLVSLNLMENSCGDKGAESLAQSLSGNTRLITLNLSQNSIGDAGIRHLSKSLRSNSCLRVLDLENNPVGELGAKELLLSFDLDKGNIPISVNTSLTTLQFPQHRVGDDIGFFTRKNRHHQINREMSLVNLCAQQFSRMRL